MLLTKFKEREMGAYITSLFCAAAVSGDLMPEKILVVTSANIILKSLQHISNRHETVLTKMHT